ncbi:hypothetical protein, partial [Pseudomonas aeruginosa]|uniref:hypothetical protein n=1 Tax=Pseudomonas aeruginosa TaxID=287 RepID=UPI003749D1E1
VDLSTVAGNKISNPPWVKFQSAGWVNFPSAPTSLAAIKAPLTTRDYSGVVSHGHSHDVDAPALTSHKHAADHSHEIPYLGSVLTLPSRPERETPPSSLRTTVPEVPIYLIERPPRSRFVF